MSCIWIKKNKHNPLAAGLEQGTVRFQLSLGETTGLDHPWSIASATKHTRCLGG